jgi:TRAP-type uncharacterized transport system substrate-binding protein
MRWIYTSIFALIAAIGAFGYWYVFEREVEPVVLTVAAGTSDSDTFHLMREVSEVLVRHSDTVRLKVVTSPNSSESTAKISSRLVDLATIEANTPAYTDINLVTELFEDYFLLVARDGWGRSDVRESFETVTDLPTSPVAIPPSGTSENRSFWAVIDHYKIAPETLGTLAVGNERARELFLSGKVNAIFLQSSLRDPFLLSFIGEAGLRGIKLKFLPIDQADAMKLKRPYLDPVTIVKGAFDGRLPLPAENVVVPSLKRVLVAGAHVDEDAVYELVRVIFENRLDLLIRMPLSLIVTIFAMLISALLALRRNMKSRAKNTGDKYNDKLLDIAQRARSTSDVTVLKEMKAELVALLERVVHALDTDQITEEGFQSFAFLWNSTKETVNEQIELQS